MHQRHVRLVNRTRAKLIREIFERRFSLRDDQQAGRVAIESMNDPGPHTARVRQLLKMVSEGVRQRAGMDSRCRMDHKTGRLVYDDQRLVFVNDLDRYRFRSEAGCCGYDQFDFDVVVFAKFV